MSLQATGMGVTTMTPKEISRTAGRIFQASIPARWIIRSQQDQEDYGIDYEIELTTPSDQATGFIFKVQEKGVEAAEYVQGGQVLSFGGLSVARMKYYLDDLKTPVVLVVVDLARQRPYWTTIHGNAELIAAYRQACAAKHETMTVHVPVANALPETAGRLLEQVVVAREAVFLNAIASIRPERLLRLAADLGRIEELTSALTAHKDYAECARIDALKSEGKWGEARRLAWTFVDSPAASPGMRFSAGVRLLQIAASNVKAGPDYLSRTGTEEYLRERTRVTDRLLEIARGRETPKRLRRFAGALCRTARLRIAVEREFGLFVSRMVQESTGDEFTRLMTKHAQASARLAVTQELHKTQVTVQRMVRGDALELVPQVWAMMGMDVGMFLTSLEADGLKEAREGIVRWFDATIDPCVEICAKTQAVWELGLCVFVFVGLSGRDRSQFEARIAKARDYVARIEDAAERAKLSERLEEYADLPKKVEAVAEPSIEAEIAFYRMMARSLGVNLEDPEDQIAEIVRIGLMDLNPERVLRTCQNFFVSPGSVGIPGQMLGLQTAGSKYLHCTKHAATMGGLTLDGLLELFAQQHCNGCPDRLAHPPEWKWTRAWQKEQDKKWRVFVDRVRGW